MKKILPNNIAVIDEDTHISKWVAEKGTLENEREFIETLILPHVKFEGSVVIDVGAFIGDHSATYSRLVGPEGVVFAIEPNPAAYECLLHNSNAVMKNGKDGLRNVIPFNMAAGARTAWGRVHASTNAGASFVTHLEGDSIPAGDGLCLISSVDSLMAVGDEVSKAFDVGFLSEPRVSLIKIDVEGRELEVLRGAEQTIRKHKPAIFYEVNHEWLKRAGASEVAIRQFLLDLGYTWFHVLDAEGIDGPQFNMLALPQAPNGTCVVSS